MWFELKFKVKTNTCGHFGSRWPAGVPSKTPALCHPECFVSGFFACIWAAVARQWQASVARQGLSGTSNKLETI